MEMKWALADGMLKGSWDKPAEIVSLATFRCLATDSLFEPVSTSRELILFETELAYRAEILSECEWKTVLIVYIVEHRNLAYHLYSMIILVSDTRVIKLSYETTVTRYAIMR